MRGLELVRLLITVGLLAVVISGMFYWIPAYVPEYMQTVVSHSIVVLLSVISTTIVFIQKFIDGEWSVVSTITSVFVFCATITAIVLIVLRIQKHPTEQQEESDDKWDNIYLSILSVSILLAGVMEQALSDILAGFTGEFVVLAGEITSGGRRRFK